MRLIGRSIPGLAAALLLVLPSGASATHSAEHPTGAYVWSANNCSSVTRRAPVTVVFRNFGTGISSAMQAIADEVPWPQQQITPRQYLYMRNSSGASSCHADLSAATRVSTTSGNPRTLMRVWSSNGNFVTAATPIRQQETTASGCGGSPQQPAWVTAPNGYNLGRNSFETAFQGNPALGTTAYEGPYPVQLVYWGNTQPISLCNGTTVSSDGNVSVIHPKDELGVHQPLRGVDTNEATEVREAPPPSTLVGVGNCPAQPPAPGAPDQTDYRRRTAYGGIKPTVIDQWQELGVTTVRFGLDWRSVAPCSRAGDQSNWAWWLWNPVMNDLEAAGIEPIIMVKQPPKVINEGVDPDWTDPACKAASGSALVNTAAGEGGLGSWRIFVEQVASRYGDTAKAIQVWNEPNWPEYWGGCSTTVAGADQVAPVDKFLQILNVARQGVEDSAHPNVPLMLPGLKPAKLPDTDERAWDDYLDRVLDKWGQYPDTRDAVDYIGLHPYRTKQDKNNGVDTYVSALNQFAQAEVIVSGEPADGGHELDKPVWVTEVGTTHAGNTNGNTYVGADPLAQGFADWAIYDTLRNAGAPLSVIYRHADKPIPASGNISQDSDFGYGVVESSLAPKFGYCMLVQERTQVYPPSPACP